MPVVLPDEAGAGGSGGGGESGLAGGAGGGGGGGAGWGDERGGRDGGSGGESSAATMEMIAETPVMLMAESDGGAELAAQRSKAS